MVAGIARLGLLPAAAEPGRSGVVWTEPHRARPVRPRLLKPTALFGIDLPPPHPRRRSWSLGDQHRDLRRLLAPRPARRSSGCRPMPSSRRDDAVPWRRASRSGAAAVTVEELRATVARYLGEERTDALLRGLRRLARRPESTRAPRPTSISCASPSTFSPRRSARPRRASSCRCCCAGATSRPRRRCKLLDDASAAIQYSRDLLQHALDNARQGVTVFDKRPAAAWPGTAPSATCGTCRPTMCASASASTRSSAMHAERGTYGPGPVDDLVATRLQALRGRSPSRSGLRIHPSGIVIEIRPNPHARRRRRHDLYGHHRPRRGGGSAGARQ